MFREERMMKVRILVCSLMAVSIVTVPLAGCGGSSQDTEVPYTKYLVPCTNAESTLLFTQDGKTMPYESLINGNIKPFYYDSKCNQNPILLGNVGDIVQAKISFTSDSASFSSYRINVDGSLSFVSP
jgi:hypothetical protein